ncbi:hypothetical protein IMG5_200970 [Ichthyophthirius multifiliis]|uniref:Uncharacterized protein n=1 Tax=Ichthyophthirius multifiliis TaxID=5932 RepID=G0R5T6_ICHMU|nr:hypothetical protein IMG5_200970 [Ichthyophthirius multifiliis]EGR27157.1 hypothetical protein IMG5_200970 [Ichthyophthirius multifiliis]|eukprot:XP_004024041.1 hypothetical protein IMG5_200970 [Ichthyophthirius multifiliis]
MSKSSSNTQNSPQNINDVDKQMIKKLLNEEYLEENELKYEDQVQELTVSSIPGTTVSFIKCKNKNLGTNIYDTPGIPNIRQMTYYFENKNHVKTIVVDREIKPKKIHFGPDLTLFIGGLVRIDHLEGLFFY